MRARDGGKRSSEAGARNGGELLSNTADSSLLLRVARHEQMLRGRLMAARAEGEALVGEARREAERMRAEGEAAADADARAWAAQELARARSDAEDQVNSARESARVLGADEGSLGAAVHFIVDAVLPRSTDVPVSENGQAPFPPGGPQTFGE